MATAFNLTAQLNLRGPNNIGNIVSDIRRQLGTINGNINFRIDPTTTRNVTQLNAAVRILNTSLTQITATANNATNAMAAFSRAAGGGAGGGGNIGNTAANINNVARATTAVTQNATNAARQMGVARTQMEEFGRQSALAIRRFAAFSVATGGVVALTNAIRNGLSAFISYEKEFIKLQQVTGESADGLKGLSSSITSLATGLGVASADLIQVSSTLAQAGLSARDTERALKALALSALAPSFDDLNKTVEGSIALMRQFDISAGDLEASLGSINAVAAKFAVESADIIAAIQRTGGVFASASKGVSEGKQALNEFIAVFTSVRATTRESAETIATGLRTIFTRIQRASTIEALKEFGVTLTDAEGKFVGAYKAVQLLSEGLNRIDPRDLKFSQIVEELGGFRQIGKVIPLIQQFTTAQQALAVAQGGAGSLTADAVKAQLSLANQITKVKEEFLALFREIGSSDSFQTIAKGALDVASALIKVADSVKGVLPILGIMMAMRGASAIQQFGTGFIGGIRRGGGAQGLGNRMAGGFATGGMVPGTGNSDTVPAMLTPGEFVIRKKAVEKIGISRLAALNRNQGGPVQYLNSGGIVQRLAGGKFVKNTIGQLQSKPFARKVKFDKKLSPDDEIGSFVRVETIDISSKDFPQIFKFIQAEKNLTKKLNQQYSNKKSIKLRSGLKDPIQEISRVRGPESFQPDAPDQQVKGLAFERFIRQRMPRLKPRGGRSGLENLLYSPLDFDTGDAKFIRNIKKYESVSGQQELLDKRYRFTPVSEIISKKWTPAKDTRRLKDTIAFVPPAGIKESFDQYYANEVKKLLQKNTQPALITSNKKSFGGFVQKFMAGQFVKPVKIPSPQDLILGPGDKKAGWKDTLAQIFRQNGIQYDGMRTVQIGNQKVSLSDVFSPRQLGSKKFRDQVGPSNIIKLENLRTSVVEAYMGKRSGLVEAARPRNPNEVSSAKEKKLLFGAAGMYGNPFPPTLVKLGQADGLKEPVDITVFGSILNKNQEEKDKKIARIQNINDKRLAKGKAPIVDEAGMVDRLSAPTAKSLSSQFGVKQATRGVARANKQLALDTVTAIAQTLSPTGGGSKIFLDFDKTLAFGADGIAQKTPAAKGKKGSQDFSAFGDLKKVEAGLQKAKLSSLGSRLINLVNKLDQQNPGSGNSLLQRMFVISARPNNAIAPIVKWLNQRGLRIPASNFRGVGGSGITPNMIALNKAEQMVGLGAGKGSVFIDDDSKNIKAASKAGITSIQYGAKIDKKTRRDAAQSEGVAYQDYLRKNLPADLLKKMETEGESVDYPFGLGLRIANGWFNDPRLANIPVDAKRTLNGPRGKIKTNIINYLKGKGYNWGGLVQKFALGGLAAGGSIEDTVPALLTPGEFVINKKAAKRIGSSRLHRLNQADKIQGFNKGGIVGYNAGGIIQTFQDGGFAQLVKQFKAAGDDIVTAARKARQQMERDSQQSSGPNRSAARQAQISQERNDRARAQRGLPTSAPLVPVAQSRQEYVEQRTQTVAAARAASATAAANPVGDSLRSVNRAAARGGISLRQRTAPDGSITYDSRSYADNTGRTNAEIARLQRRAAGRAPSLESMTPLQVRNAMNARQLAASRGQGPVGSFRDFSNKADGVGRQIQRDRDVAARMSGYSNFSSAGQAYLQQLNNMKTPLQRLTSGLQNLGKAFSSPQAALQTLQGAAKSAGSSISTLGSSLRSGLSNLVTKTSSMFGFSGGNSGRGLGSGSASMRQQARDLRSQGVRGQALRDQMGGGGRLQNAIGLSFAVPMLTQMMTVAEPKSKEQAANNTRMEGIGTAVGSATMLMSMGGPLGIIGGLAAGVGGIIKALADAKNAEVEFEKQLLSSKLQESLDAAGTALDKYSQNVNDVASAEKARAAILRAGKEAQGISELSKTPKASMVSMIADWTGAKPKDNMDFQRSQILEQQGLMSYLSSAGMFGGNSQEITSNSFSKMIPELAKEAAKGFQGVADASARFLETQFKSGKTVDSMAASGELDSFARNLALADVKIQEQIMSIDNAVGLSDIQKSAMKENIIATEAESKAREIQTRALREKAIENLNKQTTQLQNSLERTFQNMEQAINANSYSLTKLSDSAELASASLSGSAKAGPVRVDAINALNNPRGVSSQQRNDAVSQAASMFGSEASQMQSVLKLSGQLEDTLMKTINSTIKQSNASGTAITDEAMAAKIGASVNQTLSDLKLPPELATGLSREVGDAVNKFRTKGPASETDKLDFSQIINEVPQLSKVLESSRRAQEVANKALEAWQQNLNEYASAMNQQVETQVEINTRLRQASDIISSGGIQLGKALGQNPSLETTRNIGLQQTASRTGGLTDPTAIANRVIGLDRMRASQEAMAQGAAQKGYSGQNEFATMEKNLASTNLALRENYDALKDMASNTNQASAALDKMSEIRQKTQAGANIAEKLVTSSPQELQSLNRSMALLSNNMAGRMNRGSTAEDRKGALDAFNMIAPLLGNRQDSMKANVLESMLKESGIGVNGMMQGVIDSLRNPAADPQMAEAIRIYNEGVAKQAQANVELARIAELMNQNNADIAAKKLAESIQGVTLKFETQTFIEINSGIKTLVQIAQQKGPGNVAGMAVGGIVYAADGQYLNFQSKGTDTVPAMLTPGEFVVNKKATQKNLPLLKNINNGYQNGGKVNYYADGGYVFGNGWGLGSNRNAQLLINRTSGLESKTLLPALNWDWIKQFLRTGNTVLPAGGRQTIGAVRDLPYYAGAPTDTALVTNNYPKPGDSGTLDKLSWYPGTYMDGFTLLSSAKWYKQFTGTSQRRVATEALMAAAGFVLTGGASAVGQAAARTAGRKAAAQVIAAGIESKMERDALRAAAMKAFQEAAEKTGSSAAIRATGTRYAATAAAAGTVDNGIIGYADDINKMISIVLPENGDTFSVTPGTSLSLPTIEELNLPNSDLLTNLMTQNQQAIKFSPEEANYYAPRLEQFLSNLPRISSDPTSMNINGKTYAYSPKILSGAASPSYSVKDISGGQVALVVQGMEKKNDGAPFLIDNREDFYAALSVSRQKAPKPVTAAVASYWGRPLLNIGAGAAPNFDLSLAGKIMGNMGSDQVYSMFSGALRPYTFNEGMFAGVSQKIENKVSAVKSFTEKIRESLSIMNRNGKDDFGESGDSQNRKNLINKMRNLVMKISFKEMFNPNEIGFGKTTTLFNLEPDVWGKIVKNFSSPIDTFASEDVSTWIPINTYDPATRIENPGRKFPWVREGLKPEESEAVMKGREDFNKRVGDLIKEEVKTYQSEDMVFSYRKLTGPLWMNRKGTFSDPPPYTFNILDNFQGDLNPFKGLTLPATEAIVAGTSTKAADIDGFVQSLRDSLNTTGKFNLRSGLRKDKNDPMLTNTNYTDFTKANAFYDLFQTREFDPVAYKEKQRIENERRAGERRRQVLGQAAGDNAQGQNFDLPKRVAMAKAVFMEAVAAKVPLRLGGKIDNISSITSLQDQARNIAQRPTFSDNIRTIALGASNVFGKLASPDESGESFIRYGIDINSIFQRAKPLRKDMYDSQGNFRRNMIYSYDNVNIDKNALFQLIRNSGVQGLLGLGQGGGAVNQQGPQGGGNDGGLLNRNISQEDQMGLDLRGTKLVKVDPKTGQVTGEEAFSKQIKDLKYGGGPAGDGLFTIAFNPYNMFSNNNVRQSLFDRLQGLLMNSTIPGTKRPMFGKRVLDWFGTAFGYIRPWYLGQDFYRTSKDDEATVNDLTARETQLVSNQNALNQVRSTAMIAHDFFTNKQFGDLPTFEWLDAYLQEKINAKKAKEAQPIQPVPRANGGLIYASTGKYIDFKPMGTDTVPAMLTPGEFVVNKQATQRHLSVLQAINNGSLTDSNIMGFSGGGFIKPAYLAGGGFLGKILGAITGSDFANSLSRNIKSAIEGAFDKALTDLQTPKGSKNIGGVSNSVNGNIDDLTKKINQLIEGLNQVDINPTVDVNQKVQLNVTGINSDVFNNNSDITNIVGNMLKSVLDNLSKRNPGTLDWNIGSFSKQ